MKYEILGETLPVVVCHLESREKMINEGGSMCWMSPNMRMETSSNGGIGKALGRIVAAALKPFMPIGSNQEKTS